MTGPGTDDLVDGHTLDELADYLDHGERPRNLHIDASPDCQIVLTGMKRLRAITADLLDTEAAAVAPRDETWVAALLEDLRVEAHAGRSIPVSHPDPAARLTITEGAVRDMIRRAGDDVHGALIGRTRLDGDVTMPDEPIRISVEATIIRGESIPTLAPLLRAAIIRDLRHHTDLNITAVDVAITDLHDTPGPRS